MTLHKKSYFANTNLATGLAGFIDGLQNRFFGFDSRRRLQKFTFGFRQRFPKFSYYILRPRALLRKWKMSSLGWQIFGDRGMEPWRDLLKASAFNKGYTPPTRPDHLARDVILHLQRESERWRKEAIDAKKALSQAKRVEPKGDVG